MSEKRQIGKLKDIAANPANDVNTRKKAIDTLKAYGPRSIDPLTEIVDRTVYKEVKDHALDAIRELKTKKR